MRRFYSVLICCALCAALLCGCGGGSTGSGGADIRRKEYSSEELQFTAPAQGAPVAVFDTSAGEVRAVLYPDKAPQACENFIALAQRGYYDGTVFYRVESGFCIEGGLDGAGGSTTAWGGSGYPAETTDALHHYSGALCAAMNTNGEGGSVFYILQTLPEAPAADLLAQMESAGCRQAVIDAYKAVGGAPYLDYTDTVFGQVYSGMDVVDAIAQAETDEAMAPLEPIVVNRVTITTYGEG